MNGRIVIDLHIQGADCCGLLRYQILFGSKTRLLCFEFGLQGLLIFSGNWLPRIRIGWCLIVHFSISKKGGADRAAPPSHRRVTRLPCLPNSRR